MSMGPTSHSDNKGASRGAHAGSLSSLGDQNIFLERQNKQQAALHTVLKSKHSFEISNDELLLDNGEDGKIRFEDSQLDVSDTFDFYQEDNTGFPQDNLAAYWSETHGYLLIDKDNGDIFCPGAFAERQDGKKAAYLFKVANRAGARKTEQQQLASKLKGPISYKIAAGSVELQTASEEPILFNCSAENAADYTLVSTENQDPLNSEEYVPLKSEEGGQLFIHVKTGELFFPRFNSRSTENGRTAELISIGKLNGESPELHPPETNVTPESDNVPVAPVNSLKQTVLNLCQRRRIPGSWKFAMAAGLIFVTGMIGYFSFKSKPSPTGPVNPGNNPPAIAKINQIPQNPPGLKPPERKGADSSPAFVNNLEESALPERAKAPDLSSESFTFDQLRPDTADEVSSEELARSSAAELKPSEKDREGPSVSVVAKNLDDDSLLERKSPIDPEDNDSTEEYCDSTGTIGCPEGSEIASLTESPDILQDSAEELSPPKDKDPPTPDPVTASDTDLERVDAEEADSEYAQANGEKSRVLGKSLIDEPQDTNQDAIADAELTRSSDNNDSSIEIERPSDDSTLNRVAKESVVPSPDNTLVDSSDIVTLNLYEDIPGNQEIQEDKDPPQLTDSKEHDSPTPVLEIEDDDLNINRTPPIAQDDSEIGHSLIDEHAFAQLGQGITEVPPEIHDDENLVDEISAFEIDEDDVKPDNSSLFDKDGAGKNVLANANLRIEDFGDTPPETANSEGSEQNDAGNSSESLVAAGDHDSSLNAEDSKSVEEVVRFEDLEESFRIERGPDRRVVFDPSNTGSNEVAIASDLDELTDNAPTLSLAANTEKPQDLPPSIYDPDFLNKIDFPTALRNYVAAGETLTVQDGPAGDALVFSPWRSKVIVTPDNARTDEGQIPGLEIDNLVAENETASFDSPTGSATTGIITAKAGK